MNASDKEALIEAARKGELDKVKALIEEHGNQAFFVKDCTCGQSPLSWAAQYGQLEVVEYILSQPEGVDSISVVSNSGWRRSALRTAKVSDEPLSPVRRSTRSAHVVDVPAVLPLATGALRRLYHGTSDERGRIILAKGFKVSFRGQLGRGIYLANQDKAERFAHDACGRGYGRGAIVLEVKANLGSCYEATWSYDGWHLHYDSCHAQQTRFSQNEEWCVQDPQRVSVFQFYSLAGTKCPWGRSCPYKVKNPRCPGSPWPGSCPCEAKAGGSSVEPPTTSATASHWQVRSRRRRRGNFVDVGGWTPLHHAVWERKWEVVELLVKQVGLRAFTSLDNKGRTPLDLARDGVSDCLSEYISNADLEDQCAEMAEHLRELTRGKMGLHIAVDEHMGIDIVKSLVKSRSADIVVEDSAGDTPVHLAARAGVYDIVEYLTMVAPMAVLTKENLQGQTALDIAESKHHTHIAKHLRELIDAGVPALHHAAANGLLSAIERFADNACETTVAATGVEDSKGMTALHHASAHAHLGIVKLLAYIPETSALTTFDRQGRSAWHHLVERCGRRPRGQEAEVIIDLANKMIWALAAKGDIKALDSKQFSSILESSKARLHTLRGAKGQSLAHLAALNGDSALLAWLLRHALPEWQDDLLQTKDIDGKTAIMMAEQEEHMHIVHLLGGEGIGAGDAGDAYMDTRGVTRVRWCTRPIRTFRAASHSFLIITVNTQEFDDAKENYTVEKCFVSGRKPIVVSYWHEAFMTSDVTLWAELHAHDMLDVPVMKQLIDLASETGEYTGRSQCHHCALDVFNAYARPRRRIAEIPNPWLTQALVFLEDVGIKTEYLRRCRYAGSASALSTAAKDAAQEELMAKTEDIGEALVVALAEDLPLIRNIFSAGKKVLDRFKSRQDVAEAIGGLWQELRWLERHPPQDKEAKETLEETLDDAAEELGNPRLILMRPAAAAEEVKRITKYVKDRRADVVWLKINAIDRLLRQEQQREERAKEAEEKAKSAEERAKAAEEGRKRQAADEAALRDQEFQRGVEEGLKRAKAAEPKVAEVAKEKAQEEVANASAVRAEPNGCCIIT